MSHFTVMAIGSDWEKQLAPYSENTEVEEYSRPIDVEDLTRFSEYYREKRPEDVNLSFTELYKKHGKDWNGSTWREDAEGRWMEYSHYNQDSKWDWYALGGRWMGSLKLKKDASGILGSPGVFDNSAEEGTCNQAFKKDIDFEQMEAFPTFAVVKDGKWYEKGKMGWWAMVADEKDQHTWEEEFKKLLAEVDDDTLISIVDCHI